MMHMRDGFTWLYRLQLHIHCSNYKYQQNRAIHFQYDGKRNLESFCLCHSYHPFARKTHLSDPLKEGFSNNVSWRQLIKFISSFHFGEYDHFIKMGSGFITNTSCDGAMLYEGNSSILNFSFGNKWKFYIILF